MKCKTEIVEVSTSGRCDRVLRNSLISGGEWLSRSSWDWLFREKKIRCNGQYLRAGDTVSAGNQIEVTLPGPLMGVLLADNSAELVDRGHDWLFVNKPAGMPTLAQLPWDTSCFVNLVAKLVTQEELLTQAEFSFLAAPPTLEGGLVQRLDNHTSGGILVALTATRKEEFRKLIGTSCMKKTYLAVVHGMPKKGNISFWIDEAIAGKKMRASCKPVDGAAKAELDIAVVGTKKEQTLLRVSTTQGMRHIVRAALAALGTPICGDELYGGGAPLSELYPFHLLHAESVEIQGLDIASVPLPSGFRESFSYEE